MSGLSGSSASKLCHMYMGCEHTEGPLKFEQKKEMIEGQEKGSKRQHGTERSSLCCQTKRFLVSNNSANSWPKVLSG
eukprot:5084476-Amphidinium_carterae.1